MKTWALGFILTFYNLNAHASPCDEALLRAPPLNSLESLLQNLRAQEKNVIFSNRPGDEEGVIQVADAVHAGDWSLPVLGDERSVRWAILAYSRQQISLDHVVNISLRYTLARNAQVAMKDILVNRFADSKDPYLESQLGKLSKFERVRFSSPGPRGGTLNSLGVFRALANSSVVGFSILQIEPQFGITSIPKIIAQIAQGGRVIGGFLIPDIPRLEQSLRKSPFGDYLSNFIHHDFEHLIKSRTSILNEPGVKVILTALAIMIEENKYSTSPFTLESIIDLEFVNQGEALIAVRKYYNILQYSQIPEATTLLKEKLATADGALEVIALTAPCDFIDLLIDDLNKNPQRWLMLQQPPSYNLQVLERIKTTYKICRPRAIPGDL